MPIEYCSALYAGHLLACCASVARRKLGAPDAVTFYDVKEARLWRIDRVMALRSGIELVRLEQPTRWYCFKQAQLSVQQLAGIETTPAKIKAILGNPEGVLVGRDIEWPMWTSDSVNAAVLLVGESPEAFRRERSFRHRVSAKQRATIERRRTRTVGARKRPSFVCKRCGTGTKAHQCKPKHRWSANG